MPRLLQEASHAAQVPAAQGEAPSWIHILPAGPFLGRDGRGPYTLSDAQAVIQATTDYLKGADLVVDYDHQTLSAAQHAGPVPAAGWVKEMESREDGLWARVEWTPVAASALVAREYRYFSPVFDFDTRTGEVVRLKLGALTNVPNLQLQAAASRQGDAMNELLERLCYMLNLPLTTTAEEMAGQLDKLKALLTGSEAVAAAAAELAQAVGLAPETGTVLILQAAQSRLAQPPDPTKWVPRPEFDVISRTLAQLQETTKVAAVEQVVTEAMTAGKVPPSLKGWATEYATRDLDGFRKYIEGAPVIAGASHANGALPPNGGATTLTPEEESVAHAMGLSAETYLAAKKEA